MRGGVNNPRVCVTERWKVLVGIILTSSMQHGMCPYHLEKNNPMVSGTEWLMAILVNSGITVQRQ
jgi:hypothetical protein